MKQVCLILLVVSVLLPMALAQRSDTGKGIVTSAEADRKHLREQLIDLEKKSWDAWQKRDGTFFQHFLSDDHLEVGGDGVGNKAEIVAFVGSPNCVVKSYSVDTFRLTIFDARTALLTYHAAQDSTCGGKIVPSPVWVSSLYVQRGTHWLNAFYQQTKAAR